MIEINADLLSVFSVGAAESEVFAPLLTEACPEWGIDEDYEVIAFLANCSHESRGFTTFVENLNYSAQGLANTWDRFSATGRKGGPPNALALRLHRKPEQIANVVYANRMGNGDEASGDGWRTRGRGLIQVTGTYNLNKLSFAWGYDCLANPDLLTEPVGATVSACWFWEENGCNQLAQAQRWTELRKKINGGDLGLKEVTRMIQAGITYAEGQRNG